MLFKKPSSDILTDFFIGAWLFYVDGAPGWGPCYVFAVFVVDGNCYAGVSIVSYFSSFFCCSTDVELDVVFSFFDSSGFGTSIYAAGVF